MMQDKADEGAFRDAGRDQPIKEHTMAQPFFFKCNRTPANIEGSYMNMPLFLVSNGPSLLECNLELLKTPGIMTMSLNNGASTLLMKGITPDFWMCVDQPQRFVKQIWLNPRITKLIPYASFDKTLWDNEKWELMKIQPRQCPNVLGFMRNEKFHAGRFFTEESMNWGNHSKFGGGRTVLLPAIRAAHLLGFRKVYLLGVDLHMDAGKGYHFNEGRTKGAINGNNSTYQKLINDYLPGIKKSGEPIGFKIYNCNQNSAVKCFDYVPFTQAVEESVNLWGPVDKIQTDGMYLEEKSKLGTTREAAIAMTHGLKSEPQEPPKKMPVHMPPPAVPPTPGVQLPHA